MKEKIFYFVILCFFVLTGFIFYSKFSVENNQKLEEENFVVKIDTTKYPKVYESLKYGFKINTPEDFKIDENYRYLLPGNKYLEGVKFSVPERFFKGTNLSSETYISVEKISNPLSACSMDEFSGYHELTGIEKVGKLSFSKAISISAGVGNRYDETILVTKVEDGCLGIRFFIHYTVIENYPEGSVKEYDDKLLRETFSDIFKTIEIKWKK